MDNTFRYVPAADIFVFTIGCLMVFLLRITYTSRNKIYRIFRACTLVTILAAALNMFFYLSLSLEYKVSLFLSDVARIGYYGLLTMVLVLYNYYLMELVYVERKVKKLLAWAVWLSWDISVLIMAVFLLKSPLPVPKEDVYVLKGTSPFFYVYLVIMIITVALLLINRAKLVKQVFEGILWAYLLSMLLLFVQELFAQRSFTTAAMMLPTFAMMYLLHANPYDLKTGAIGEEAFEDMVQESHKNHTGLIMMFLDLHDRRGVDQLSDEMRYDFYRMFPKAVRGDTLFRINGGKFVEVFRKNQNQNYEEVISNLIRMFDGLVDKFHRDFKIVITEDVDFISATNSYGEFVDEVQSRIPYNTYYRVTKKDVELFQKRQYILAELRDIEQKADLNDERVVVYCQPVLNVETGKYDSAEALMRLDLPLTGMVFPDQFIPLAEQEEILHPLSLIILNKTCQAVKALAQKGQKVTRISVNISIPEMRDENFCRDILQIIEENDVPCDRIAIEVTESQNEPDFELVKQRMSELKEKGITFYLDDFGTGYSNMERIMELPFDIIKFDRSLVTEARRNEGSRLMVNSFARIFRKLNYRVLYEGVEDVRDEVQCISMEAQYLQGYKYSKPIPITELEDFLEGPVQVLQ